MSETSRVEWLFIIPEEWSSRPGWMGLEHPGLVENVPVHGKGLEWEDLEGAFQDKLSHEFMQSFP